MWREFRAVDFDLIRHFFGLLGPQIMTMCMELACEKNPVFINL